MPSAWPSPEVLKSSPPTTTTAAAASDASDSRVSCHHITTRNEQQPVQSVSRTRRKRRSRGEGSEIPSKTRPLLLQKIPSKTDHFCYYRKTTAKGSQSRRAWSPPTSIPPSSFSPWLLAHGWFCGKNSPRKQERQPNPNPSFICCSFGSQAIGELRPRPGRDRGVWSWICYDTIKTVKNQPLQQQQQQQH